MVAFSHKYTIHMKNFLQGKMPSISPKESIFSLKSSNLRTAGIRVMEGRLTYFIQSSCVLSCETMQFYNQDLVQQEHLHSSTGR